MKKEISLALYFSLFFSAISAFSSTISSGGNAYEVDPIESTSSENITPMEHMHWCNSLENNDSSQTEDGVYEFQGDRLLSINLNATHFLCTQDQIDREDLSPQDVSSYQDQTLYLVTKQGALAERPSNEPNTSQANPSSTFDNQGSSVQKQTANQSPPDAHPIEHAATRILICHITRLTGLLTGMFIGQSIVDSMIIPLALSPVTSLLISCGIVIGCTFAGLAIGWAVGAYVGHYFFH